MIRKRKVEGEGKLEKRSVPAAAAGAEADKWL